MTRKRVPATVSEYMAKIGAKGGAAGRGTKKPRKRATTKRDKNGHENLAKSVDIK